MVRERRLALRPVDWLLLAYLGFASIVVLARGGLPANGNGWLLGMHALAALLILLGGWLGPDEYLGNLLRDFYPLILVLPLYTEVGVLNQQLGVSRVLAHDRIVQTWEYAVFHGQPSYELIRRFPSVFLSGLLHLVYLGYYVALVLGPVQFALLGRRADARRVIFGTMVAFVCCFVPFILFPVAGPYFAFPNPTGRVRDVWSAKLVYAALSRGSSLGAAFPSSHVGATLATSLGVWSASRRLGVPFLAFAALLTVATVYCQMHYAVDAMTGLAVGVVAWGVGTMYGHRSGMPAGETGISKGER
jgi:membrane-associated phospholipid phosphatase